MLKKGCVNDLKSGAISRDTSYIVITMCHYPRGIPKAWSDEYVKALAPDAQLLKDFLAEKKKLGNHNAAFGSVKYERRFTVSMEGMAHLQRLAGLSATRDVTLVCQCGLDVRCHRELLLILARRWYGTATEPRKFSYPEFERRVPATEGPLAEALPL